MSSIIDRMIVGRELGTQVPISIGSALAIEAALGIHPEIQVSSPPILETKMLMINVRTLIRNLLGALTTDARKMMTDKNLFPALLEEMNIIETAVSKQTNGMIPVVFYYCSYRSLKQKFPNALLRMPNTEIQKFNNALESNLLMQIKDSGVSSDLRVFDVDLSGKFPDTFIMTHAPVDLLSSNYFSKLVLLESHTGNMKKHLLWNSKLTNGKELTRIPFNRFTLQVFGDNGVHFSPLLPKVKQAVKDIADKYEWTSITTMDKIKYSVSNVNDKIIRTLLISLW